MVKQDVCCCFDGCKEMATRRIYKHKNLFSCEEHVRFYRKKFGRNSDRKICNEEDCLSAANYSNGKCYKHNGKLCLICVKEEREKPNIAILNGLCKRHFYGLCIKCIEENIEKPNIAQVKGLCYRHHNGLCQKCLEIGKETLAQKGDFCRNHAYPCSVKGCLKQAQYNGLCHAHGGYPICESIDPITGARCTYFSTMPNYIINNKRVCCYCYRFAKGEPPFRSKRENEAYKELINMGYEVKYQESITCNNNNYRVDFYIIFPDYLFRQVIIEIDENCHKNENPSCHKRRNSELLSSEKTAIIRFNPDSEDNEKYDKLQRAIEYSKTIDLDIPKVIYVNYEPTSEHLLPCDGYHIINFDNI
jgi:very-short-patch-repair endonuclease